jgi:hypothetical protein
VHYPESVSWRDETLARRPGGDGEPHVKTLIELPTFAILAPSHGPTHPSGRPYVRLSGGFHRIAAVTAEEHADLVTLARTFDAMLRPQRGEPTTAHRSGDRPGDDFNRRASWPEILEPAGWQHVHDCGDGGYWCRPGKTHGVSASTNLGGHDRLYVFTSSTPFEPETSYTKFAAYAVLHHGGDFAEAARDVAAEACTAQSPPTPGDDPPDDREAIRAPIHARPVLVRLQDVRPEPVTWLWPVDSRPARSRCSSAIPASVCHTRRSVIGRCAVTFRSSGCLIVGGSGSTARIWTVRLRRGRNASLSNRATTVRPHRPHSSTP